MSEGKTVERNWSCYSCDHKCVLEWEGIDVAPMCPNCGAGNLQPGSFVSNQPTLTGTPGTSDWTCSVHGHLGGTGIFSASAIIPGYKEIKECFCALCLMECIRKLPVANLSFHRPLPEEDAPWDPRYVTNPKKESENESSKT